MTELPTPPLPEDTLVRGGSADDLDDVLAVIRAAEEHDLGEPMTSRADVAGDWARPSMRVATDTVVVEQAGGVVAHAEQFGGRAFVHVHPEARGLGIGAFLADWTEAHARAAGLPRVGQTLPSSSTDALGLLAGRGYRPRWETWVLERTLTDDLDVPEPPDGLVLRGLHRPDEDRALYELVDTAFSEWADRDVPMAFEDWRASHLDRDGIDSEFVLLTDGDGWLVGAALCVVEEGEGWVDQLAVARSHRGRGLGQLLLRAAFRRFRDLGLDVVSVATDSRTGARGVYERAGMSVTWSFTRMSLSL